MLAQIANDVQRGIAMTVHDLNSELSAEALQRCVARAMPAAVDMTLRGYPNAALEIGQNEASVEIATARKRITNGGEA